MTSQSTFPSISGGGGGGGGGGGERGRVRYASDYSDSINLPPIAKKEERLVEDIDGAQWLSDIGMEQYIGTFIANLSFDGKIVLRRRMAAIRQQDLSKMNIMDHEHQKFLMQHIRLVLKHPFHSQLHRKHSSMIPSPVKKDSRKQSRGAVASSNAGALDGGDLNHALDGDSSKAISRMASDDGENAKRLHECGVKSAKELLKEKKKVDRRRRSFDNSVWQSISSLRTKENRNAVAVAQLREGIFNPSPSLSEARNEAQHPSKGARRRWSFGNEDYQSSGSNRDKGTAYGNLALEFDMLQTNLRQLENEYMSKFCSTLNCEKASIFFVNEDTHELLLCADNGIWYRIPRGSGIAGYCAETGHSLNIPDAYKDFRFNQNMDKKTGFRTRNILCQPVRRTRGGGSVCAVIEMMNKRDGQDFAPEDEEVLNAIVQRVADLLSDKFKDLQQCARKFSAGAIYVGNKGSNALSDGPAGYAEPTKLSKDRERDRVGATEQKAGRD